MAKILVTGGAGYIGSVLVHDLVMEHDVVVVDNLSTGHDFLVNPLAHFEHADLRDRDALKDIFQVHKPDCVMHLAALSVVSESAEKEVLYRENNVQATANLLSAMRAVGCEQLVFSSTAAVYGAPKTMPITEAHPCQPINVYGETKLAAEEIILNAGIRTIILRYFNAAGASNDGAYGEFHEPETHLIPSILLAVQSGQTFKLFGDEYPTKDGTCVRDYVDVRDIAQAHQLAMDCLTEGSPTDIFNLGSNQGYSVKEIIRACELFLEKKAKIKRCPPRLGDPAVLIASNTKVQEGLHWSPMHSIDDMIKSAWHCFDMHSDGV